jgi:hypothetical protein
MGQHVAEGRRERNGSRAGRLTVHCKSRETKVSEMKGIQPRRRNAYEAWAEGRQATSLDCRRRSHPKMGSPQGRWKANTFPSIQDGEVSKALETVLIEVGVEGLRTTECCRSGRKVELDRGS